MYIIAWYDTNVGCGPGQIKSSEKNMDPDKILEKNTDPDPTPPTPSKNWIRNQDTVKEQLSDIF